MHVMKGGENMTKRQLGKRALATALAAGVGTLLLAPRVFALDVGLNAVESEIQLGNQDIRTTIASIINVLMGLLGIIAVVIILLGGFKWMTAGGNEDKVGEAKKLIMQGIIGLVIILSAWAIARFVIDSLVSATTNGVAE